MKDKGYGLFLEYAIATWRFKEIFTPVLGLSAHAIRSTSEIMRLSNSTGNFEELPVLQTNAVLLRNNVSFLLGIEAEMHRNVAIFLKTASGWGIQNLAGSFKGSYENMRTKAGISFRI